jgi:hypothetical protein
MKIKLPIAFLLFCSLSVHSALNGTCQRRLKAPLNFTAFQSCQQTLTTKCQPDPLLPTIECRDRVLQRRSQCQQSLELAALLPSSLSTLQLASYHGFYLADNLTIGDGEHLYTIITPNQCLVSTTIDVRDYDLSLKKQYETADFLTLNAGKPTFQILTDETVVFNMPLRIHETCRACPLIGHASVDFHFAPTGQLIKVKVLKFTPIRKSITK